MTAMLYALTCGRLVGRLKDMIEGSRAIWQARGGAKTLARPRTIRCKPVDGITCPFAYWASAR